MVTATGLGANANELARDWPVGRYRGGHPDWMVVGKAIRAVDYNRGAQYTGIVGKADRGWLYDPNVYLYRPAADAFVNTIGANLGETSSEWPTVPIALGIAAVGLAAALLLTR